MAREWEEAREWAGARPSSRLLTWKQSSPYRDARDWFICSSVGHNNSGLDVIRQLTVVDCLHVITVVSAQEAEVRLFRRLTISKTRRYSSVKRRLTPECYDPVTIEQLLQQLDGVINIEPYFIHFTHSVKKVKKYFHILSLIRCMHSQYTRVLSVLFVSKTANISWLPKCFLRTVRQSGRENYAFQYTNMTG